jgi:hypothetical protein
MVALLIALLEVRQLWEAYQFTLTEPRAAIEDRENTKAILMEQNNSLPSKVLIEEVHPQRKKYHDDAPKLHVLPRRDQDSHSSFSACLLVMDDNHFLIEWLAYHYHTLPLRYLVIAVDPRSRTSPQSILDRWASKITVRVWNDTHFLPQEWLNRGPKADDATSKFVLHRERQRNFYPTCLQALKHAGRQWTMVVDIDEFVLINPHYLHYQNTTTTRVPKRTLLESIQSQANHSQEACITMPRLRFGNYKDGNATKSTLPNQDWMLTYRWQWRAGLHNRKVNRNPKSMVNVGLVHNFSRADTDAHRPVRSACPKRNMYILNKQSPWSVHHYVGSREQFEFRKDARDGLKQRDPQRLAEYGQIREASDKSMIGWFEAFVQVHGMAEANRLIQGVGNVSYSALLEPN